MIHTIAHEFSLAELFSYGPGCSLRQSEDCLSLAQVVWILDSLCRGGLLMGALGDHSLWVVGKYAFLRSDVLLQIIYLCFSTAHFLC